MTDFYKFFVISGCGWVLDLLMTMTLVQHGVLPFFASLLGAGMAVTFVYIVSLFTVFQIDGIRGMNGYGPYVLWQIFSISAASALVACLASLIEPAVIPVASGAPLADIISLPGSLSLASGIAKALVTPLTLVANFFFMRWLTGRLRLRRE